MKGRPRRVENEVAGHISKYLATLGLGEVKRIPVLGRTGPDIEIWPKLQVAVDVKSRKAVPKSYKLYGKHLQTWSYEGWWQVGCKLCHLDMLFDIENFVHHLDRKGSAVTAKWLGHMWDWCQEEWGKYGIEEELIVPALVLHWPGTPVKNSTFIIYERHRRYLDDRRKRINDLRHGASDNQ